MRCSSWPGASGGDTGSGASRSSPSRRRYVRFSAGADLLLHDGEFSAEEYGHTRVWGHSTWEEALGLALDAGVRRFGLWHHNMGRDDGTLERIVGECRVRSRAADVDLEIFAATQGQRLTL